MSWTFYTSSGEALVQHAESEATQAEMEGESAVAKFVPPDLVKNSPGVAKAWAMFNMTGTPALVSGSYNVDNMTDEGTGAATIIWDTDMSSTSYVWGGTSSGNCFMCDGAAPATTHITVKIQTHAGSVSDEARNYVWAFGDQ